MKYEDGFPKTMVHPAYMPAMVVDTYGTDRSANYVGRPDRFPPVTVMTPEHEEDMRARGYLNPGESPARQASAAEYPKMLAHPQHVDGTPPRTDGRIVGGVLDPASGQMIGGHLETFTVPAMPEKYPHVTVENAEQEAGWAEKGYLPNGRWDEIALDRAQHAPEVAYEPDAWPRMIYGPERDAKGELVAHLVHDPDALTEAEKRQLEREYPKMIGDRVVKSAAEEYVLRSAAANGDEVLLGGAGSGAPQAPTKEAAPGPSAELSLMQDMLGEMRGMLGEMREIQNERVALGYSPLIPPSGEKKRKGMSAERREEMSRRMTERWARKRAEREAQTDA